LLASSKSKRQRIPVKQAGKKRAPQQATGVGTAKSRSRGRFELEQAGRGTKCERGASHPALGARGNRSPARRHPLIDAVPIARGPRRQ